MPEAIRLKIHLLSKRAKIMKFLQKEGYSDADIATMFNLDRSAIGRILSTEKKYKDTIGKQLSDK